MFRTVGSKFAVLSLLLALSGGCASEQEQAFQAAQEKGTIEAYEDFMTRFPENNVSETVKQKLDDLYYNDARSKSSIEGYKAYLDKFGVGGKHSPEMRGAYEKALYDKANKEGTKAALEGFLAEFPDGNYTAKVKRRVEEMSYGEQSLAFNTVKLSAVNLVMEDGSKKKGWELKASASNKGDKTVESLSLNVAFKGADGADINSGVHSLVESGAPMAPGETREFVYQNTEVPDGASPASAAITVKDLKLAK